MPTCGTIVPLWRAQKCPLNRIRRSHVAQLRSHVSRFRSHDFLFRSHKRQMRSEKATLQPGTKSFWVFSPYSNHLRKLSIISKQICMAAVLASFPTSFTSNAFGKRLQELMVGISKLWVEEALYVDYGGLYSWAKQKTKQNNNFFQNLQKNIHRLLVFHKAIGWNLILLTISLSSNSNSGIYFLSLNSRTYSFLWC